MKKNTRVFQSVIARKLSRRMLAIYSVIYVIILLLLFVIVTPLLTRNARSDAETTLELMANGLDASMTSASDMNKYLTSFGTVKDAVASYNRDPSTAASAAIELALTDYASTDSSVLSACLEDLDGNFFCADIYKSEVIKEFLHSEPRYMDLLAGQGGSYYTILPKGMFLSPTTAAENQVVAYTSRIRIGRSYYIARTYYLLNACIRNCDLLCVNEFSGYAIICEEELQYVSDGFPDLSYDDLEDLMGFRKSADSFKTVNGIYCFIKNASTGMIMVAFSPNRYYLHSVYVILAIVTGLYLLSPILYTIFLVPAANRMLSPIGQLNQAMHYYSVGDEVSLDLSTGDEIEALSNVFKDMSLRITQQMNDIQSKEHINAITNYKLLATQIDPHFIYNTMNIINILARQGNTNGIVELNTALIRLLRERLSTKISISDTIDHEVDALHQYSLIMDYRYERQIILSCDVDRELDDCLVPKNILQPLVENSFYHGFTNLEEGQQGHIDIIIYEIDDDIVIEISDDGCGIPEEKLEELQNHSYTIYNDNKPHIGIDNIRQRLAYVYGDRYSFEIHSTYGFGTSISITIPKEMPEFTKAGDLRIH